MVHMKGPGCDRTRSVHGARLVTISPPSLSQWPRTACSESLPTEVRELVLDELPVCDRLAIADVSTGWREACTTDTLHAAVGWAVLEEDATSDERCLFYWSASGILKTGGTGGVEEGRELLRFSLPLAARAELETQRRFTLLVLRVVATVSRLLDGIGGGTTPMLDLQRWSEHVLAASSSRVFPLPACVRDRSPRDV